MKSSEVLEGVVRHHSIVVVSSCDQHSWELFGIWNVVSWRELLQVLEVALLIRAAEIRAPGVPDCVSVEAKQVHHADSGHAGAEELWSLVEARSDEQAAVRAAHDANVLRRRVLLLAEILSSGLEVVIRSLLL